MNMHTFSYGGWSINYNSDLSGTAIITKGSGWNIHMPCDVLNAFCDRMAEDAEAEREDLHDELRRVSRQLDGMRECLDKALSDLNQARATAAIDNRAAHELAAKLEELRAKATPTAQALHFAKEVAAHGYPDAHHLRGASNFILSLAPDPKRKTRIEAAAESFTAFDEVQIRAVLKYAGVDPDEEMPEAT